MAFMSQRPRLPVFYTHYMYRMYSGLFSNHQREVTNLTKAEPKDQKLHEELRNCIVRVIAYLI